MMGKIKYILVTTLTLVLFGCSSHEDKVKEEHDAGKEKVEEKAALVQGVGEGLKTSGKSAIESLSEGVGAIIKGAESGFDKSLTKVNVKGDTSVSVFGLAIGKSGKYYNDTLKTNVVSVYAVFDKDFGSDLLLIASDAENMEVGRVKQKVTAKEGESKYVDFVFDKRVKIDIVKEFKLSVNYKKKK